MDQGYVQLTLMLDGTGSGWADAFGATYPVITDNQQDIARGYTPAQGGSFGIPMYAVLDREMRIVAKNVNGGVANQVAQLLDSEPPEVEWLLPEADDDE